MTNNGELRLVDFLRPEAIVCNMPALSRSQVIVELVELLGRDLVNMDKKAVVDAMLERENVAPTVIASGLAIPHARLDWINQPHIAVGISRQGIDFSAPDKQPVNIVILILTPKSDPAIYLRVVAGLSRLLETAKMREKLIRSASARDVYDLLAGKSGCLSPHLTARDVMNPSPPVLKEGDSLATAITTFCRNGIMDISIVDEDGDLRGVIAIEQLLRLSLPEHLLWMEDLSPMLDLQPFADLLLKDQEMKIADFLSDAFVSVQADTPAIQLAKIFLTKGVRQIQVLEGRRLAGVVSLRRFIARIFWA